MNCAYCEYNDGVVYTSNPPKYRCSVTGEYHLAFDDCNVEFAPVKHGMWVKLNRTSIHEFDGDYSKYICSVCGRMIKTSDCNDMFINRHFPYCHCGAKMDEVTNNEND